MIEHEERVTQRCEFKARLSGLLLQDPKGLGVRGSSRTVD